MMGERESAGTPPKQVRTRIDGLTPELAEKLADMALMSERHRDLSLALGEAQQMLASVVEVHPQFQEASAELQDKLKQLEHLQATLGTAVMKYSHHYEDGAVGIASAPT